MPWETTKGRNSKLLHRGQEQPPAALTRRQRLDQTRMSSLVEENDTKTKTQESGAAVTMDDDHQGLPPPAAILGDNEAQWNPPGFFVPPPLLQPHQQQQHQHHPENDVESHGSPRSSGWSEVETVGGVPPSARSLHSAALLNVSHSLLLFFCGMLDVAALFLEQSPGKQLTCAGWTIVFETTYPGLLAGVWRIYWNRAK
jgi:hypothetical protein